MLVCRRDRTQFALESALGYPHVVADYQMHNGGPPCCCLQSYDRTRRTAVQRLRVAAHARRLCPGCDRYRGCEQTSYRGKVRTGGPITFTPSLTLGRNGRGG
jgi:hypothetical protein